MPKPYRRSLTVNRASIDVEKRQVELSVSSDSDGITRWLYGFGDVREILGHKTSEIDLSRFANETGGPLLYNHDFSELIGRFTATEVKDGKLRGLARFANTPQATALWDQLRDGILCDVSITYDYSLSDVEVAERNQDGSIRSVRVKRWTPLEVSFVTVPADASVGLGRGYRADEDPDEEDQDKEDDDRAADEDDEDEDDDEDKEDEDRAATKHTKRQPKTQTQRPPRRQPTKEARVPAVAETKKDDRTVQILKLADEFGVTADKRNEWIGQGATLEQVHKELLDGFRSAAKPLAAPSEAIGVTEKDRRQYSIATALRAVVTGDPNVGGLEREVSKALAARLGRDLNSNGILIPTDMPMRDVHNTKVPDAAGNLVFKEYAGYLELLKNTAVVLQMGASVSTGLQGTPTWVKQTGTSQSFWIDENPATGATESNLTWTLVSSTPKTAKALLRYTRQQVIQSVEAFEPLLQKDLLENDTLAIDTAALVGTGTQFQPLGLLNTPGIQSHAIGANGGKPTYADITRLKTLVKKANALALGDGGYLTTPEIEDLLMNTPRLGNQIALPIWGEDNRLAGYKALGANQVPSNLTKGSANGICHALIFGIWSELFLLEWGALEMVVDPYTQADKDIVRVTTSHLVDVFVRRPQAFAAIKDATTN